MVGAEILVVDDDQGTLNLFERVLQKAGYKFMGCQNGQEVLKIMEKKSFHLAFLDIHMPVMNGIQLLEEIKIRKPETMVVMMTAFATVPSAIETMKKGAYDYLTKPLKIEDIKKMAMRAIESQKMEAKTLTSGDSHEFMEEIKSGFGNIIGQSKAMQELFALLKKVAPSDSTVLITGESGTGKELAARAIHTYSPRHTKQLVTINCADMPESVMENELFGHTKGSYTGAYKDQKGLLELADKGTVFLDEIGDLPEMTQVKLLRFLQERVVKPVGGLQYKKVDVRVITATNADLPKKIEDGTFRSDLYYRLRVIPVHLPPLRERKEDIPLLVNHFINIYSGKLKTPKTISREALGLLVKYPWPGNVRELENLIEYLVVMSNGQTIVPQDLPKDYSLPDIKGKSLPSTFADMNYKAAKKRVLSEFTQEFLRENLIIAGGNITKAAELIGIERANLHRLIRKYDIDLPNLC